MALVTGSIGEKGRLLPFLIFCLFWTTIVYDPIAYWMWNFNGWSNKQGSLDWAGGTPVHITSGAASLSYALMMKYNRILSEEKESKLTPSWHAKSIWGRYFAFIWRWPSQFSLPTKSDRRLASHNMTNATLGCMLLWFGWFGFNAGSELKANMRAASTFLASNLAACTGGITFCLLEQRKKGHRWTCLGFCTGAIAGLVAITPGAGYVCLPSLFPPVSYDEGHDANTEQVPAWAGLIYGVTVSIFCYFIMSINSLKAFLEEPLDIAILHGLGGLWGMFMTGIFAETKVINLDGTDEGGGAISGRAFQIGYQILGGLAGFSWSFGVTLILLIALQIAASYWPPLALRSEDKEVRRREGGRVRGRMKWMIGEELGKNQPYRIICRYHRLPARTADPSNPNNTEDVEYEYEYDEEENEDDSLRDDHCFEHDHDHSQGSVSAASGESMQMSELNAHTNGRSGGGEHGRSVSQVSAMTAVTVTGPS